MSTSHFCKIVYFQKFYPPQCFFLRVHGTIVRTQDFSQEALHHTPVENSDENETSVRGGAFFCKMTRGPTRLKNILIATLCLLLQIVISYQQLLGGPYSFVKPLPSVTNLFSRRTGPSLGSKSKRIFILFQKSKNAIMKLHA